MKKTLRTITLAATCLLLIGATKQGCVTPPEPRPDPIVKVTALKPSLTPLAETPESQEKGGIGISMTPVTYTLVEGTKATKRTLYERVKTEYDFTSGAQYQTPVRISERTITPVLNVQPDRLRFQVKINNKLSRVFRGQGMVVQFNVAGKLHRVDPSGYAELTQTIVPPRNEIVVENFYGPPLSELPNTCPVGIFLYDVVTKIDDAGNVVEKQNFEWYFNYATQLVEREGTISVDRIEEKIGPTVRVR